MSQHSRKNQTWGGNPKEGLKLTRHECPSCHMFLWHRGQANETISCPFCFGALPTYVAKLSPETMIARSQFAGEVSPVDSPRRQSLDLVEQEESSPFTLEFHMVQTTGFRCMAYRSREGKWRGAFDHHELCGEVRVLE